MITIIEKGTKHKQKCEACGCLFSYENEDIEMNYTWMIPTYTYIRCPQCRDIIRLKTMYENIERVLPDDEEEDEE